MVEINEAKIINMVRTALKAREQKLGLFAAEIIPPEKPFIDLCKSYERDHSIDSFAANSLFFFITTLFADNSARQFTLACRPAIFYPNAWIFRPNKVVRRKESAVIQAATEFNQTWL